MVIDIFFYFKLHLLSKQMFVLLNGMKSLKYVVLDIR